MKVDWRMKNVRNDDFLKRVKEFHSLTILKEEQLNKLSEQLKDGDGE